MIFGDLAKGIAKNASDQKSDGTFTLKTRNFAFIEKNFFFEKYSKSGICHFSTSGFTSKLSKKVENVP